MPKRAEPARTDARRAAAGSGGPGRSGKAGTPSKAGTPRKTGTPSKATFRRRRLIVLVVLALLVVGAVVGVKAAVGALTAGAAAPDADPTSTISPTAASNETVSQGPTDAQLANPVACVPEAVSLTVTPAAETITQGAKTSFPVTVANTGQIPCLLDVGFAQLVVTIYSGDDLIWSSQQCADGDDRRILLDVGAEDLTTFSWKGVRSQADCPDDPAEAKPGSYRVVATLYTAAPEDSDVEPSEIAVSDATFTIKEKKKDKE